MTALGHELYKLRLGSAEKIFIGSIMVALPDYLCNALLEIKKIYPLLSVEVVIDTSDRLIELLRDGTLEGATGPLGFDGTGQRSAAAMLVRVEGQGLELVSP